MNRKTKVTTLLILFVISLRVLAQSEDFTAIRAEVDFTQKLRTWDGFGFNYVETAHSYDYKKFPQEYGGFSLLKEDQKQEIIDLVFGADGLKVGLVKMFFGALHQKERHGAYDHESYTSNMRYFVREGLKQTRSWGGNLEILTTLYGPPGFMTSQKQPRGRDLDPDYKTDLAEYMINWVKFLKEKEKFPVKYLSLHNEGEDWSRWNQQGITTHEGHDYNLYWTPELVSEYVKMMPLLLKKAGLSDIGITPGETTNWYRFHSWGYADALASDSEAVKSLGLITSHGFYSGNWGVWFGEHTPYANDMLRAKRPELHSWVTSTSWSKMDARNIKEMHGNIYTTKVNGIIPWAGIQRPTHWPNKDPNPGCAIVVKEDGTYEVTRGYYFYKQITRAGQPGMAVAKTFAMNSEIAVIGFAANGTSNPNSFVVTNISNETKKVVFNLKGIKGKTFQAFRTTADENDNLRDAYTSLGMIPVNDERIVYDAPAGSVTTFFEK